jgi:hypothetical protein
MKAHDKPTASAATPVRRPRRLWPWFAGGFLLVFVGMLLLVHMTAMHPSGQYAARSPLWQYYADSLPRLFGPSTLGPASGGSSALLETALIHLLFSTAGGAAVTAVGWCVGRLRNRRAVEPNATPDRGGIM